MARRPLVTAIIPAYDAEAFVGDAVLSALAQDLGDDGIEVVVVDDGSTDRTAPIVEAIAADHPGRVTLLRQENRGQAAAVTAGAAIARGELLATLDADDVWPPGKLLRQATLLHERPEVGLVYGDMCVIDRNGAVLQESWLEGADPPEGDDLGRFLEQNLVTGSSIVVRASLRDHLFPIPDEMPWSDWWLAVRAAEVSQVAYLAEPRTLYRFHGGNVSLGVDGPARLRELRKALRLQRWFLRRMRPPRASAGELERAWDAFARIAAEALAIAGTPFVRLVDVDEDDRRDARSGAAEARVLLTRGALVEALGAAVRAAAADPGDDDVRGTLLEVRAALPDGVGPQPLRGARPVVVRVAADELVRHPALLRATADALGARAGDVTLAIDAADADPAEARQRVPALVAEAGLDDDHPLDVVLVCGPLDELGRARLAAGTTAVVGERRPADGRPWLSPDRVGDLCDIVSVRPS